MSRNISPSNTKKEKTGLAVHDDKWVPHTEKPISSRFRRSELQQMYDDVVGEFSANELKSMLRQTWEVAAEKKDGIGMMRVLQFVMDYAIGKPVQRSITVGMDSEALLRFIKGEGATQQEMSEAIEIDVEQT